MSTATLVPQVMMTSYRSAANTTTISVERVYSIPDNKVYYTGKGQHTGIFINNPGNPDELLKSAVDPEMQLEFTCRMYNANTNTSHAENRRLKFWFNDKVDQMKRLDGSYEFFKELINPTTFPRDYVGFIKKVMKQLQLNRFENLRRVDFDLIALDSKANEPEPGYHLSETEVTVIKEVVVPLEDRITEITNNVFPNVVSMEDLVRQLKVDEKEILVEVQKLVAKDIIQSVPLEGKLRGQIGFRRNYAQVAKETVKEVPEGYAKVAREQKPTIAIITNLLCEKLAVDAMMKDRTTFVRFKTEGESHVYSIGYIGGHKVISTKLPMVGRLMKEKISSGNTTTRLLGAFQSVKHVFLVGVGGSVPHVYEFEKHSRLGDIVVAMPLPGGTTATKVASAKDFAYVFCEKVVFPSEEAPPETPVQFLLKYYKPEETALQQYVEKVLDMYEKEPANCPWLNEMNKAMETMKDDVDFSRPPPETDRYKINMGNGMTFELKHPEAPAEVADLYREGVPAVRLGPIGSGRPISDDDQLRDPFAHQYNLLAWDAEYDQVLESIMGNRLGSYVIVRGMADYVDGHTSTNWQPYAALSAAGFMKAVIKQIPVE